MDEFAISATVVGYLLNVLLIPLGLVVEALIRFWFTLPLKTGTAFVIVSWQADLYQFITRSRTVHALLHVEDKVCTFVLWLIFNIAILGVVIAVILCLILGVGFINLVLGVIGTTALFFIPRLLIRNHQEVIKLKEELSKLKK